MTRPITQEQVFASANLIARNGEMPTIAGVRKMLGGRGSETTILNHLTKWKTRLLQFATMIEDTVVDPDVFIYSFSENAELKQQLLDLESKYLAIATDCSSARQNLINTENSYQELNLILSLREQQIEDLQDQILKVNQIGFDKVIEASQANYSQLAVERANNILLKEKICIIKEDLKELQGTHTLL